MVILLYPVLFFLPLQSISYFKQDVGGIRSSTSMKHSNVITLIICKQYKCNNMIDSFPIS